MTRWKRISMRLLLALLAMGLAASSTATAETSKPNQQADLIRGWIVTDGNWRVLLVHTTDNRFVCSAFIGERTAGDAMLFGFEEDRQNMYLLINDQNPASVTGKTVRVLIDDSLAGTYPIDRRHSVTKIYSIRAAVPQAQTARLLGLLGGGANLQMQTAKATYSASLAGMPTALTGMRICLTEARGMVEE